MIAVKFATASIIFGASEGNTLTSKAPAVQDASEQDDGQFNLSFKQIECFRNVMLLHSTMAASKALRVSQPSVSRAILKMEDDVGFRLFIRDGNRMKPTADGLRLYQVVERTIDGLTEIERTTKAIRSHRLGRIRIICLPVFLETLVARAVGRFSVLHPDLHFDIETGGMVRLLDEVGKGRFELGIGGGPGEREEVRSTLLERRPIVVVAPAHLDIGRNGIVEWEELIRHRLVGLLPESPFRKVIDQQFEKRHLVPDIKIQAPSQLAALTMVQARAGISLVDAKCIPADLKHLQVLQLPQPLHWDCHLISPRHDMPGHALRAFVAFLKQQSMNAD